MVARLLPLSVRDVSVVKRGKAIIGSINLELEDEGITAIIGPNGTGKTTLLRMLHGIEQTSGGELIWGECSGARLNEAFKHQAFVFQNPIMLRRSVIENLIYPLMLRKWSKSEALKLAEQWLERVELSGSINKDALVLSGGERQKLALARALITKPKVLFLDEPTSNLDGHAMAAVEQLIKDARADGVKVIIATHDFGQLRRLADSVIFMLNGKIHEFGTADAILRGAQKPETEKFLNGEIVL